MNISSPENISNEPDFYAIELKKLKDDTWHDIVKIYYSCAYGEGVEPPQYALGKVKNDIKSQLRGKSFISNSAEFRFGSRVSLHSKLVVSTTGHGLVRFGFRHNNIDIHKDPTSAQAQEAEHIGQMFDSEVNGYLLASGRGVPIYS